MSHARRKLFKEKPNLSITDQFEILLEEMDNDELEGRSKKIKQQRLNDIQKL